MKPRTVELISRLTNQWQSSCKLSKSKSERDAFFNLGNRGIIDIRRGKVNEIHPLLGIPCWLNRNFYRLK